MDFRIYPAFAVPFDDIQCPDAERLNPEIRALLLSRETEGAKYANPNPSLAQLVHKFYRIWPPVAKLSRFPTVFRKLP